jgi:hypothetical protein
MMSRIVTFLVLTLALGPAVSSGQDAAEEPRADAGAATGQTDSSSTDGRTEDQRILWIIPNYRSSPTLKDYQPMLPARKFEIARNDSFDRGTFTLAALFAVQAQLTRSTPSFGRGLPAYGRYATAAYGDLVIGNFMSEAVFPTLFGEDPRFFRRCSGSGWSRLGYAMGQTVWTRTDSGGTQFNFSEVVGNGAAVAIGNAYYPDNRNISSNAIRFGLQLGVDMAANVLKEFWPDLDRMFSRNHRAEGC